VAVIQAVLEREYENAVLYHIPKGDKVISIFKIDECKN
jgi:hypothetical protein